MLLIDMMKPIAIRARERARIMDSTCMVCLGDFDNESMIEDINGTKYCLLDSGDICLVCGIYGLECECEGESNE
jgi:hypothetical protein